MIAIIQDILSAGNTSPIFYLSPTIQMMIRMQSIADIYETGTKESREIRSFFKHLFKFR